MRNQPLISTLCTLGLVFCPTLHLFAQSQASNSKVSISNISSGAIITVYRRAVNSWLWGYHPNNLSRTSSWTWEVIYNPDSTLTFLNTEQRTCLQAHSVRGITHNTCRADDDSQKFQPILTSSGAIQLRSISLSQCINLPGSGSRYAFDLTFATCATGNDAASTRQLWVLNPETVDAPIIPPPREDLR
ncbi:Cytolethal distending toxin subunit A [Candidatus Burkholderia brachyanthoides]|nr:Cytolethal distending toxin subunit A [Candidatus Burkholderia brachyanthoides]